tara:strand:+ start:1228 stop:1473 length:246 start_codon:yes stop_codon:yes gene_type:complete
MKTKVFKIMLPALAVVMAVGLAFATETNTIAQEGYYNHPALGWQSVMVEDGCGASGAIPCTFNDYQLYAQPSYSSTALRKN